MDALARQKNSKRHFFGEIKNSFYEMTHIGLEPHQFFLFKISQQIQSLETFKVSAEMGRGRQAVLVGAKSFWSNLRKHVMNKC